MYIQTSQLNIVTANPTSGVHASFPWVGVDSIQNKTHV